jgi:hypothetical protein
MASQFVCIRRSKARTVLTHHMRIVSRGRDEGSKDITVGNTAVQLITSEDEVVVCSCSGIECPGCTVIVTESDYALASEVDC